MKLLFILPEYGLNVGGGIATFYRNLLPELTRRGHSVRVLVASLFGSTPAPGEAIDGVEVEHVRSTPADLERFGAYAAAPDLQRQLALARTAWERARGGVGFDVVETTDWGMLFVPWATADDGPPVVVQLNGSNAQIDAHDPIRGDELRTRLTQLLEVALLPLADELQSYGRHNAEEWSGLLCRQVEYIPPGWTASDVPVQAPVAGGATGLVVGRVQAWKGPHVLCEALRRLGTEAPVVAWAGGDSAFERRSQTMSAHLAATFPEVWGTKVRPLGRRSAAETAALQAAADFIAVPSTWDVFNLAAVEGMGRGRVVVCSRGAGASVLIEDGVNGLSRPAGDGAALADALTRVRSMSRAERAAMGEAGRRTVETELEPGRIAERRLERYRALASGGRAVARPAVGYSWLRQAAGHGDGVVAEPLTFLDRLPLKKLARYTLRRGLDRLLGRRR